MAAVSPAHPVPRITVSRMEFAFSMPFLRFTGCLFGLSRSLAGRTRGMAGAGFAGAGEPGHVGANHSSQFQGLAILGHDFRGLAEKRLVRALVGILAAGQHDGTL